MTFTLPRAIAPRRPGQTEAQKRLIPGRRSNPDGAAFLQQV
jgi:hypothetical protein